PGHTYTEEGAYTVNVSVTHETAATLTVIGAAITVNEVQITNLTGTGGAQTIDEGGSTAAITGIATFTDPAGAEPVADYAGVIDFGDGSGTVSGMVVNVGGNNFRVDAPPHTYVEEGAYTINVSVTHDAAATLTVAGAAITVNEVQLTNFVVAAPVTGIAEGTNAGPLVLGTFTDPAGAEPVANYTATIDWGDGSGVHAGTVTNSGGNNFTIQDATHLFIEEGNNTLTVTVKHETAPLLTQTATYTVTDPAVVARAGSDINAVENGTTALVVLATFTDPGNIGNPNPESFSEYDATIDWGDGSTANTTDP